MLRVGSGFDAHRFAENRKLFLGGVEVKHSQGLAGHSDADVLLHSLADALLGAAGLGDLGTHFPDSDGRWKDARSTVFISEVLKLLKKNHWQIVNVDLTIIAEVPRIDPYRSSIRQSIAGMLNLNLELISVKATTTNHMGFVGREEGIAAQAIVLIAKVYET